MGHQVFGRGHDLGDTGLVIGPEQRRAGRGHDVVADLAASAGSPMREHRTRVVGQRQVAPVVGPVHDRPDIRPGHLRRRIDVCDESNHRHIPLRRRRGHGGHHVAVVVDGRVGDADVVQFPHELAEQRQLTGRIGTRSIVRRIAYRCERSGGSARERMWACLD